MGTDHAAPLQQINHPRGVVVSDVHPLLKHGGRRPVGFDHNCLCLIVLVFRNAVFLIAPGTSVLALTLALHLVHDARVDLRRPVEDRPGVCDIRRPERPVPAEWQTA